MLADRFLSLISVSVLAQSDKRSRRQIACMIPQLELNVPQFAAVQVLHVYLAGLISSGDDMCV